MTEKKKIQQKLKLSKKTISVLNDGDLRMINGGDDPYISKKCTAGVTGRPTLITCRGTGYTYTKKPKPGEGDTTRYTCPYTG